MCIAEIDDNLRRDLRFLAGLGDSLPILLRYGTLNFEFAAAAHPPSGHPTGQSCYSLRNMTPPTTMERMKVDAHLRYDVDIVIGEINKSGRAIYFWDEESADARS